VFVFYLLVQFLHVHPSQFLVLNIRGPYLRQDKLLHSTPRSPLKYSGVILWWRRSRLSRFGVMGSSVLRVEDHPFRHSADAIERYRVAVMSLLPLHPPKKLPRRCWMLRGRRRSDSLGRKPGRGRQTGRLRSWMRRGYGVSRGGYLMRGVRSAGTMCRLRT